MSNNTSPGGYPYVGQLWRDRRTSNVRTLRVDSFLDNGYRVVCTVIRQEYQGEITEPMRVTEMTVLRLTGREFVPLEDGPEVTR